MVKKKTAEGFFFMDISVRKKFLHWKTINLLLFKKNTLFEFELLKCLSIALFVESFLIIFVSVFPYTMKECLAFSGHTEPNTHP